MRAVTSGEIERLRLEAESKLIQTCTIQTNTRALDSAYAPTDTWTDAYTLVPCFLSGRQIAPDSGQEGGKYVMHTAWQLSVAWDQSISAGDRVVIGGDTFDVISVEDDSDNRALRLANLLRAET